MGLDNDFIIEFQRDMSLYDLRQITNNIEMTELMDKMINDLKTIKNNIEDDYAHIHALRVFSLIAEKRNLISEEEFDYKAVALSNAEEKLNVLKTGVENHLLTCDFLKNKNNTILKSTDEIIDEYLEIEKELGDDIDEIRKKHFKLTYTIYYNYYASHKDFIKIKDFLEEAKQRLYDIETYKYK